MVELRFKEKQLNDLRVGINRWRLRPDLMQPLEKMIKWIEEHAPAGPVFPPSEPPGLEPIAYYQIERLKDTLTENLDMDTGSKENIAAVLKAYRTGVLVPRPGVTTYWYKGIQKESPGPPGDRSDALAQWVREHGEGRLWIENVSEWSSRNPQMAALSTYPPLPQIRILWSMKLLPSTR